MNVFDFHINEVITISVVAFCIINCIGRKFVVMSSETFQWDV
jgi:hypothetical protein